LTADVEARQRALQRPSLPEDVLELQHTACKAAPRRSQVIDFP
jgi:hypothetical protein